MVKILLFVFLLIPSLSSAQWQEARMTPAILGGVVTGGGGEGCSAETDYLGAKGDYSAGNGSVSADFFHCQSVQATTASCASGNLGIAYTNHYTTNTDNIKLCLYTDSTNGTGAPNGETLIGCSGAITCSTQETTPTCTDGLAIGGSVTKDDYYFLCATSDSTAFAFYRTTTGGTIWTKQFSGGYASPPNPLTGTNWTDSGTRTRGMYIAITD